MNKESVPSEVDNLLLNQNRILDEQVQAALAQKSEAIGSLELPPLTSYVGVQIRNQIEQSIADEGYDVSSVSLGRPTNKNAITSGVDLAINVAPLSTGSDGPRPPEIANNLATKISEDNELVEDGSTIGPFVNIKLDYQRVAPMVLGEVSRLGEHYGHFRNGKPKVVVVDYSAPNVAKNMTAAHLRSTIIGHSLTKIEQAAGNIPFGINHVGDWGTQFGKIIYEYRKELDERGSDFIEELENDPTSTLMRIYRAFNEREDSDPQAVDSAREIFRDLERGNPELVKLWQKMRDWSMRDFAPTYERLGVNFDAVQGESFYEDRMGQAVNEALEQGVLQHAENGAVVFPGQTLTNPSTGQINDIMRDKEGNPRDEIVVKPNGGTVYLTRDLAAIKYRTQELGADEILYVIGKEQEAHCLKLFAIADKMGYIALGNASHVSFGHLNVDGRKMKSRAGKVVLLNDILDEAETEAKKMWLEHNPQTEGHELSTEATEAINMVGIGSVIFNDLRQSRIKDIEFNPDFGASVKEGSVAYIQYTNARLNSVLDKVGQPEPIAELPTQIQTQEREVVSLLSELPLIVAEAAQEKTPHKIATYLTSLCKAVNSFYRDLPIKNAETREQRNFRLNLAVAAKQVINNAANLIHIELPEKM